MSKWIVSFAVAFAAMALSAPQAHALKISRAKIDREFPGYIKIVATPEFSSADVLFVVDDSGSMMSHQANLSASIPYFVQSIPTSGVSVHAGVITTSVSVTGLKYPNGDGKLVGTTKVADSASPTFAQDLQANLLVGTSGSGTEMFFDPLTMALSEPTLSTDNAGFLRKDAHLAIVFVTDAEDQSATKATPEAMVNFLDTLKGRGLYSTYGFIVPSADAACPRDDASMKPVMLEKFLELTGGQVTGICSPDYGKALSKIADKLISKITREIPLTMEPVFETIEVTYGGAPIAKGDLHHGWIFDSATNTVVIGDKFEWWSQPRGSSIEVKFVPKQWK